jgi:hypothetical protein
MQTKTKDSDGYERISNRQPTAKSRIKTPAIYLRCKGKGKAWEIPKRTYTKFKTRLKFEIKSKAIPLQATRLPGSGGSQILRQSAHEGGWVVSPTHRPPLTPGNIPGTHFC